LLKYFPGEALAAYLTLEPLVRTAWDDDLNALKIGLWATLGIAVVFCWMYLKRFWKIDEARQRAISVGGLTLYVAAIGGPFETLSWYKPVYGVMAAVVASLFLIFVPSPPAPPDPLIGGAQAG
jgi:hypothetical protein